jgi:hypothetical protein
LNISVCAKENSSAVSVTLRINLTLISLTTRINNASSGVLLVDELDAHDLSADLRFQLFGVSATDGNVDSLNIRVFVVFGRVVFYFFTCGNFLVELHHCVAANSTLHNRVDAFTIVWLLRDIVV